MRTLPNLVSSWPSRVPAARGHCSHRCTLFHRPARRRCVCVHTPRHTLSFHQGIHIFVAQPRSPHQSHPSLAVRRKHFPSIASCLFPLATYTSRISVSGKKQNKKTNRSLPLNLMEIHAYLWLQDALTSAGYT